MNETSVLCIILFGVKTIYIYIVLKFKWQEYGNKLTKIFIFNCTVEMMTVKLILFSQ